MTPPPPRRWPVSGLSTISAIMADEDPCGIYVLEFANGEYYVGQAKDVRKRFVNHCRDTAHHPAWKDITHISFTPRPARELNIHEATMIQHLQKEKKRLRNRSLNLFHEQPSPLDRIIPPVDQFHWADSEYLDRQAIELTAEDLARTIADLPPGKSRMSRVGAYERCLWDIATFIELVLPEPLKTMEKYWTISDTPSTNGGRHYTLNVGVLEMLRCVREWEHHSVLNTVVWPQLDSQKDLVVTRESAEGEVVFMAYSHVYPKAKVTFLEYRTGTLDQVFLDHPQILSSARALAVALMRTGTAGMFRRWHSKQLTREALTVIWEDLEAAQNAEKN